MDIHDLTRSLHIKNDSKIVMLVADGLGGLPLEPGGPTELEAASTPNLDALAKRGVQGGSIPVAPGISPGSGPGHLGLFGYDPVKYLIGRGALEATGIGFELGPNDVAVRCNFCTLDAAGNISDRRAGRIPTEESAPLAVSLRQVKIPGVEVFVEPVKEHRFVVVFRAADLGDRVDDTDPQRTGVPPLAPHAHDPASERTAKIAAEFVAQARDKILVDEKKANGLTMRGFAARPALPSYEDVYGLKAAAVAVYPMYKGLARLVGMDIVGQATTLEEQIDRRWPIPGTTTTSSSSTSSTPTAPAKTATSPPRSRRSNSSMPPCPACSNSSRPCSSSPATTARRVTCAATVGTRCRRFWFPIAAAPMPGRRSAKANRCWAVSASSRPSTS